MITLEARSRVAQAGATRQTGFASPEGDGGGNRRHQFAENAPSRARLRALLPPLECRLQPDCANNHATTILKSSFRMLRTRGGCGDLIQARWPWPPGTRYAMVDP